MTEIDLAIIGGGIVGLTAATRLQQEGHRVCLIDPTRPGTGCSGGNAGYLSVGNFFPINGPTTWRSLPCLLFNRNGPLVIRPAHLPRLTPWALELMAASRPQSYRAATAALAQLTIRAIPSLQTLLTREHLDGHIDVSGGLHVYRSTAALQARLASVPVYREHGVAVEVLPKEAIRDLEPSLTPDLVGALWFPDSGRCVDPRRLCVALAERLAAQGGRLIETRVTRLVPSGTAWRLHTDMGELNARKCIVAAGRWSDELLEPLGYRVPLEAERGYHLMLPETAVTLRRPVVFAEHYFVATPMTDGLRLAGTVEFAGRHAPANMRRAHMLYAHAQRYLPGLARDGATSWMGSRPSLPDSVPAIGRASRHDSLFFSFGHQHCGLTLSAISADLLADLIANRPPIIDPRPYSLDRFNRAA